MSKPLQDLIGILDLEPLDVTLFRGHSPQVGWARVFGGLVISQALVAACRTVNARTLHSIHAYFLLPGDPAKPILYDVERIRDGKSFTTRRVKAIQNGEAIFTLAASFHQEETGLEHHLPMPDVPGPEDIPAADRGEVALDAMPEPVRRYYERERPILLRPVELRRYADRDYRPNRFNVWFKTTGVLPDDLALHQAMLAYASDMTLLDTALIPHGRSIFDPDLQLASLDHAIWFHQPFRADEWLLYSQDAPFTGRGRGFSRGSIYRADGALIASVAQEGLFRLRRS
jgi:acyl-CoA thioesterase II